MDAFDYVVIGGGSSGCIVAAELSADPNVSVLLIECGDRADDNPETLRADGYKDAFVNDRVIWERFSVPQPGCLGKSLFMGSGRGLGGSGAVNAMVYLRGGAADFAQWGVQGWSWSDVVPAYEELEARLDVHQREPTSFTETCIAAAEHAGFARKADLNDGTLLGHLGYEWMNYRDEERRSSYAAFLRPHEQRPNLRVLTNARAAKLVFDDARRICGVELLENGARRTVAVRNEVVLCAGALETPKLLMLSGVGPADELRAHGIVPVLEQPGIGANLMDHPNVTLFYRGRENVDCNYPQLYGFHRANPESDLPPEVADTCYVFYPARSSLREALIRMLPAVTLPQVLYHNTPLPAAMRKSVALAFRSRALQRAVERIYGLVVILGKPKSRGEVRLTSTNVEDQARIDPAYFAHPEDMETMLEGVRLARKITDSPAFRQWGNLELMPGRLLGGKRRALELFIRNNTMTTYHFCGTCRMGDDASAVVDNRLRLRGVQGVRIADASVIPVVPVSALNGPSMLVGFRASQFLRAEQSARPSSAAS